LIKLHRVRKPHPINILETISKAFKDGLRFKMKKVFNEMVWYE